jgi:hypothetical protein
MLAKRPEDPAGAGAGNVRAAISVVAVGLLLGGVATLMLRTTSEWMAPGDARAAATPGTKAARAASATPARKPVAAPVAAKPVPVAPATKSIAGPALRPGGAAPNAVHSTAHLDDQLTYQYNALGRRDPFQAMVGGDFVGADVGGDAPVDIGGMKVVGVVWGSEDRFALVEDGRGNSLVLRPGDKVMNGVVEELRREAVVVKLTVDGQTQSVVVPLTRKGDHSNANR